MTIKNSTIEDLPEIFRLYRLASAYQKSVNAVVVWGEFDKSLIEREVAENRQWKLLIDDELACVWATTLSDEQIWKERNLDKAIYIHRIATNPAFRGQNLVFKIVEWAKDFAREHQLDYVRLDTVGENEKLIEYYTKAGFGFLGMFDLKDTSGLPAHYHKLPAALFEIKL